MSIKKFDFKSWFVQNQEMVEWVFKCLLFLVAVILGVIKIFIPNGYEKGYLPIKWVGMSFVALICVVLGFIAFAGCAGLIRYLGSPYKKRLIMMCIVDQLVDYGAIFTFGYLLFWWRALAGVVVIVTFLLVLSKEPYPEDC